MVNASKKAGLGRTLIRAQKLANDRRNPRKSDRHTVVDNTVENNRIDLRSVTAQTNLDEFFEEAELAGKQFVTERRNLALINEDEPPQQLYDKDERVEKHKINIEDVDVENSLSVPRRPKWDSSTTPEVLAEREKLTFLAWRKKLAKIQENDQLVLTPFEKNLEVWRQLWRVIERSNIVVQILDCRNPLLYLCDDLIKYVNEEFNGKKMNLILLNKADYLTRGQRQMWSFHFKQRGIKTIFFSALQENANIKRSISSEDENSHLESDGEDEEEEDQQNQSLSSAYNQNDTQSELDAKKVSEKLQDSLNINGADNTNQDVDDTRVYDKFELLDAWRNLLDILSKDKPADKDGKHKIHLNFEDVSEHSSSPINQHIPTVGLVGYPNVGKSSTINALLSAKRVAVSATPGKTKHFQTFLIDKDMMLCDCPGLVFPNFVGSKAEMIINGVLPIDQMKDCAGPVRIIVSRIPRGYFEEIYGLAFDHDAKQNIIADDLLNALGFMRGYMTARGLPDISRAARKVCKDYINGKILYCEPPPDCDRKEFYSLSKLADQMKRIEQRGNDPKLALRITERQRRLMAQAKGTDISSCEFDARYFQSKSAGAHIKGLPGIGNMTQPIGSFIGAKLDKREKKHKKKEKLRRVYRDLDI